MTRLNDTAFITLAVIHSASLTQFGGDYKRTYKGQLFRFVPNTAGQ